MTPTTRYCRTCNARERVIVKGKCLICGNDPSAHPELEESDESTGFFDGPPMIVGPNDPHMERWDTWHDAEFSRATAWHWLDWWVFLLCVTTTLYLTVQVARWMM